LASCQIPISIGGCGHVRQARELLFQSQDS